MFNILPTHCSFVGVMTNFVHAYYKCDYSVLHNNNAYVHICTVIPACHVSVQLNFNEDLYITMSKNLCPELAIKYYTAIKLDCLNCSYIAICSYTYVH